VAVCPCDFVPSSAWWRLREGTGLAAVDSSLLALTPGTLQPSLTWFRGSLRFALPSDYVLSSVYLPDPTFTRDMHVRGAASCFVTFLQCPLAQAWRASRLQVASVRELCLTICLCHR
jgi:hypothetical protein